MSEPIDLVDFIKGTMAILQEQAAALPEGVVPHLMSGADIPGHRTLYVFMISATAPLEPTPARRLMAAVIPMIATDDVFSAARHRLQTAFDESAALGGCRLVAIDPEGNHEWFSDFVGVTGDPGLPVALVMPILALPFGFVE